MTDHRDASRILLIVVALIDLDPAGGFRYDVVDSLRFWISISYSCCVMCHLSLPSLAGTSPATVVFLRAEESRLSIFTKSASRIGRRLMHLGSLPGGTCLVVLCEQVV
jgi:hypothetical protein